MDWQTLLIIVTLLVGGYSLYLQLRKGEKLTPIQVVNEVKNAQPIAKEIMEIAQIAVNATEELRRQGTITDNKTALNHALTLTKKWIPDEWEVPNEDILSFIDSAILVASALRSQADPLDLGKIKDLGK